MKFTMFLYKKLVDILNDRRIRSGETPREILRRSLWPAP